MCVCKEEGISIIGSRIEEDEDDNLTDIPEFSPQTVSEGGSTYLPFHRMNSTLVAPLIYYYYYSFF